MQIMKKTFNTLLFVFNLFKSLNFSLFLKFVIYSKTNKDKSTKIVPPFLLTPLYLCACAMQRAKKRSENASIFKKTTGLFPSRSYYSKTNLMLQPAVTTAFMLLQNIAARSRKQKHFPVSKAMTTFQAFLMTSRFINTSFGLVCCAAM